MSSFTPTPLIQDLYDWLTWSTKECMLKNVGMLSGPTEYEQNQNWELKLFGYKYSSQIILFSVPQKKITQVLYLLTY